MNNFGLDSFLYSDQYFDVVAETVDLIDSTNLVIETMNAYENLPIESQSISEALSTSAANFDMDIAAVQKEKRDTVWKAIKKWFAEFINKIKGMVLKICTELDDATRKKYDKKLAEKLAQLPTSPFKVDNCPIKKQDLYLDPVINELKTTKFTLKKLELYVDGILMKYQGIIKSNLLNTNGDLKRTKWALDAASQATMKTSMLFKNEYEGRFLVVVTPSEIIGALEQKLDINDVKDLHKDCENILNNSLNKLESLIKSIPGTNDEQLQSQIRLSQVAAQIQVSLSAIPQAITSIYKKELVRRDVVRGIAKQMLQSVEPIQNNNK